MKDNIQNAGNNSTQIIGSKNFIFNFFQLDNSYQILSDIAKEIVLSTTGKEDMNIEKDPVEIFEKIAYNHIPSHESDFKESIIYLEKLEFIIEQKFGKQSEILIDRIKYNWNRVVSENPEISKDNQIYKLSDFLNGKVKKNVIRKYCLENIETAIELMIFYVFTKCQILDNPNN